MGYPDTGRICLGTSYKIRNGFYTYTRTLPVSKSDPNNALKLHKQIETILDLIETLYLENFKIRLPVTDQTSVIVGSLFSWSWPKPNYIVPNSYHCTRPKRPPNKATSYLDFADKKI